MSDGVEARAGGERLVVDDDQIGRVLGDRGSLRDHHGDGLARKTRPVLRKQHLGRLLDGRAVAVLHHAAHRHRPGLADIVSGQHTDDAGKLTRRARIDALDRGVRMGAADKIGVGLVLEPDVVRVVALPGDEADVLSPPDGLPDAEFHVDFVLFAKFRIVSLSLC